MEQDACESTGNVASTVRICLIARSLRTTTSIPWLTVHYDFSHTILIPEACLCSCYYANGRMHGALIYLYCSIAPQVMSQYNLFRVHFSNLAWVNTNGTAKQGSDSTTLAKLATSLQLEVWSTDQKAKHFPAYKDPSGSQPTPSHNLRFHSKQLLAFPPTSSLHSRTKQPCVLNLSSLFLLHPSTVLQ